MTQRSTILIATLTTALAATLALAPGAPASVAPADSTATAPAAAYDSSTAVPPAESAAASADTIQAAASDSSAAKSDAKSEAKETGSKKAKKTKTKAAGGGKGKSMGAAAKAGTMPVKPEATPQRVQVQHILIGFTGSVPGKPISRTKEEAKTLAFEVLERARKGEDFDELVKKYTDDSPPGIYGMSAIGIAPAPGEYSRDGMVPAFGNVGFAISPGNIGIADYDAKASPFGWHIIKRLK